MGLIEQALADIQSITSNLSDFGVELVMLAPNGQTATITGLHTKINLGVDTDGNMVNSKKAQASISESKLLAINPLYPLRGASQEVNLRSHKVTVKDSTGNNCTYVVKEWFPDETIGLITMILGDYE